MDFGLAKRDAGEITMTIDCQILGTPAYMSSEQARGEGHQVDGRSDVYSLGVILYQLVSGELPFRGNTRDLDTVALKAMAKEPGRPYASAQEMAEDRGLRLVVQDRPNLGQRLRQAARSAASASTPGCCRRLQPRRQERRHRKLRQDRPAVGQRHRQAARSAAAASRRGLGRRL